MSGSDPGGSSGSALGASASSPCESLRLERNLEAPVPGVADELEVGDLLNVVLRDGQPALVIAIDQAQREVGGILPTGRLIECLRQGFRFEAKVTRRTGGAVQIEVRTAR